MEDLMEEPTAEVTLTLSQVKAVIKAFDCVQDEFGLFEQREREKFIKGWDGVYGIFCATKKSID